MFKSKPKFKPGDPVLFKSWNGGRALRGEIVQKYRKGEWVVKVPVGTIEYNEVFKHEDELIHVR